MNFIGRFIRSVLRPTKETTRIAARIDEAVQRNQEAATEASKAVEALLSFMESSQGGNPPRPAKK